MTRCPLWGLATGQDPYKHEWTTEPIIVCGGDGGGATCGGSRQGPGRPMSLTPNLAAAALPYVPGGTATSWLAPTAP
ncbi:hypothetical protein E1193_22565 [Micromonospora sp. KC606]|nr:hypothetical protein E1193_22565 [Micromonospora sp. KC606]